jgi:hypothetical protein
MFSMSHDEDREESAVFQGQIWVDDRDYQIVKTYGKAVPDIRGKGGQENLFRDLRRTENRSTANTGFRRTPRCRHAAVSSGAADPADH